MITQSGDLPTDLSSHGTTVGGSVCHPLEQEAAPVRIPDQGRSGVETRDNSRYSAEWLVSIGYAVLIYDKRGTGKSDGDKKSINFFSIDDLSDDLVAGINYLSKLDKTKIGIHATSQGGWVATLATLKTNLISFMIVRSASVSTVGEDRIFERSARLKKDKSAGRSPD